MKISNIKLRNYKIFKGEHNFGFSGGLIFLVGENNTGKSTLFDAVNFLKSGLPKEKTLADIKNKFSDPADHVSCTIKLTGNIKQVINDFSEKKYEKYVFDEAGTETIILQRSSEDRTVNQGGKDAKLDIKTVTIWNNDTNQFENPSGIDKVLGTLFEAQFVWADTDPGEIADFGTTKICGRLLNEVVGDFFKGNQWQEFTRVHRETFHGTGDSLGKRAEKIENDIKEILRSQYGVADIKFDFSLPEASTFYKTGEIIVNDGADTKLEEKGTGMQRAVALAIIQVYARSLTIHPTDSEKSKPLFFFIDEPEICLHPKAQHQLLDALIEIAKNRQIFVSTHSPYLLRKFNSASHDLLVFNKAADNITVTPASAINLFKWSPSLGEINHRAYGVYTAEFHNELYGHIQEKESKFTEKDIELFFVSKGHVATKTWVRVRDGVAEPGYSVSLMTFIRNTIHHTENRQNSDYSEQELKESIEAMILLA